MSRRRDSAISRITTIQVESRPNLVWVEIETEDGLVGVGETFSLADAVAAYIHEGVAPYLLGEDASAIQRHWTALFRQRGRSGIGVETRGASAIDIGLWDLLGRRTGLPLYQLLGGASRDEIRVYNTCGGPDYVREPAVPGRLYTGPIESARTFEDLWAFRHHPEALAADLLEMGITGMKIWPFDEIAQETAGQYITGEQLSRGLAPVVRIRESAGTRIDIAVEMHGKWSLAPALKIAKGVEEYQPMWIEDPIRLDNIAALAEFCRSTSVPTSVGETLGGRFPYREVLERAEVAIVMTDPCWVGGITEARRIADLASLYQKPFTPHDCAGPVNLAVDVHLSAHAETAFIQEVVRAFYYGWYPDVADGLPELSNGIIKPATRPGHGVALKPEMVEAPGTTIRTSTRD
jgi:L-alanine-DL-glutamate epimerase-like enolase superfamily enzyme